jgi:gamma-glutamylcyclotransferase (GGCT)/AIG2-like uncharacterized protein YtfP
MTRVFVYGSLRKGFGNHGLLANSLFIEEATTKPTYSMLHLGSFPGLIPGNTAIQGEVYDVDDTTLVDLDRLEGYPHLYGKELASVELPWGTETALVYVLSEETANSMGSRDIVESGDWNYVD